jgi:hypothetical protein
MATQCLLEEEEGRSIKVNCIKVETSDPSVAHGPVPCVGRRPILAPHNMRS